MSRASHCHWRRRPNAVALLAVLLVALGCARRDDGIDLIELYPSAEKRSTFDLTQAFSVLDIAIGGIERRSIVAHAPARLSWSIVVPRGAQVETWTGLRPEAWARAGDGVVFRIGVSTGSTYTPLAMIHLDPFNRPPDRRWVHLEASLAAFSGQTVNLIFSTDASPAGRGLNAYNDLAVWGDPRVAGR